MIADEFRRQVNVFTDLVELRAKIGRGPSERAVITAAGPVAGPKGEMIAFSRIDPERE
jgi:hypothetical protein